jgi:hypothetical protein
MCQRQAAFGHHLYQVAQAQLEAKIPAHAQDDDLAVEVTTLEQLLDAHQLAHAHPSGSSADIIAGQILPFAPEPGVDGRLRYGVSQRAGQAGIRSIAPQVQPKAGHDEKARPVSLAKVQWESRGLRAGRTALLRPGGRPWRRRGCGCPRRAASPPDRGSRRCQGLSATTGSRGLRSPHCRAATGPRLGRHGTPWP